jgi:hypothetical protein
MPRNRTKKAVPDDFISFEDIDFDVDFLFDEIPNDEDLPTCGEQSNDDTIGQTEGEDEIETTTYLRKPGKSTYYSTSSYRPINLTCIMCKLMERVILEHLIVHHTLVDLRRLVFHQRENQHRNQYPQTI